MTNRMRVSREQALNFNPRWDDSDRRKLRSFLDGDGSKLSYKDSVKPRGAEIDAAVATIPERLDHMYRTQSNGEIKGVSADGAKLFTIRPGAIDLRMGINLTVLHFSTVGWWGPRSRKSDDSVVVVCPIHHLQLPKSGVCDFCD